MVLREWKVESALGGRSCVTTIWASEYQLHGDFIVFYQGILQPVAILSSHTLLSAIDTGETRDEEEESVDG